MHIVFNHKFGQQELNDIQHHTVEALDVNIDEYDNMLANGWLQHIIDKKPKWYQSRSVRCNLANTSYSEYDADRYAIMHPKLAEIEHIYTSYCFHKGFADLYQREVVNWFDDDICIEYYNLKNEFVAWSKLRSYTKKSLETVIFAWDYRDPKLKIGYNSLKHELAWAKKQGYDYVYLGPGYEEGCVYKSEMHGFEWWTGSVWSEDKNEYGRLCKRDSAITTIAELSRV
jgi:hypothetical protein